VTSLLSAKALTSPPTARHGCVPGARRLSQVMLPVGSVPLQDPRGGVAGFGFLFTSPLAAHRAPKGGSARVVRTGLRAPFLHPYETGFYQVRACEELCHLLAAAERERLLDHPASDVLQAVPGFPAEEVRRPVRHDEVTTGRHGVKQPGHDRVRVVGVRYRVQEGEQRDRCRLGEVQQRSGRQN
jgi:hypothetical protein